MKIYIACGLTHVPRNVFERYVMFLHRLAAALRQCGKNTVRYALVDSDPQLASKPFDQRARLCYLWDREMVEQAELIIAEASFPSTGLGIELQVAAHKQTPTILCFRDFGDNRVTAVEYVNPDHSRHQLQIGEGYVSLMALGIPTVFRAIRYNNDDHGIGQILEAVALLEKR